MFRDTAGEDTLGMAVTVAMTPFCTRVPFMPQTAQRRRPDDALQVSDLFEPLVASAGETATDENSVEEKLRVN